MKNKDLDIFQMVAEGKMTTDQAMQLMLKLEDQDTSQIKSNNQLEHYSHESQNDSNLLLIHEKITNIVSKNLHLTEEDLVNSLSFKELGIDSISSVEIIRDVNKVFMLNLDAVTLYDYPTIEELSYYVKQELEKLSETVVHPLLSDQDMLKEPEQAHSVPQNLVEANIRQQIIDITAKNLHLAEDELDMLLSFKEMGIDSISSVEIIGDINKVFHLNLDAVTLYDYPTVQELSHYIFQQYEQEIYVFQEEVAPSIQLKPSVKPSVGKLSLKPKLPSRDVEVNRSEGVKLETSYNNQQNESSVLLQSLNKNDIRKQIMDITSKNLHLTEDEMDTYLSFKEMGIDSISGVEIIRDINNTFELSLDAVALYDFPTIDVLTDHVLQESEKALAVFQKTMIKREQPSSKKEELEKTQSKITLSKKNKEPDSIALSEGKESEDTQSKITLSLKTKKSNPKVSIAEEERNNTNVVESSNVAQSQRTVQTNNLKTDIAVIGMSGAFPGAKDLHSYWENLVNGVCSVTEVPKERWDIEQYYDPDPSVPNKTSCRVGGYLENVDHFDPLFFNISPLEAEFMDPQQRLFLEHAWKAIEDAGYSDQEISNVKCGVFVGTTTGDYSNKLKMSSFENTSEAFTGLSSSILAARISYFLNLKGPSIALDTACSSSLVAIHQACQSIIAQDSDMAIAGGVALMLTPDLLIKTSKMGMLSPDGVCRAFDYEANGTIMSEGVGVVVLKSLERAIQDRDHIYGVIKGSGVNQDGKTNGITAPSAQSQMKLQLDVYHRSGIDPENITYVEAHGTGTSLGDPIEVKALKDAFQQYTSKKQYCTLGSVKNNIGHATMAAGVASLIKVLLSMKYKKIPPLLHFKKENQHIRLKETPFCVNTEIKNWDVPSNMTRLAAVSSFGFSGTNCHLVVEEYQRK